MLRRVFKNPDGGVGRSLSGVILPGCASLIVPILAVTSLELPAAAIDRIAAPLLGRSTQVASLFRPPSAHSAIGDTQRPYVTADDLVVAGAVRPSALSGDAVGARVAEHTPSEWHRRSVRHRGWTTGATRRWILRGRGSPRATATRAAVRRTPRRAETRVETAEAERRLLQGRAATMVEQRRMPPWATPTHPAPRAPTTPTARAATPEQDPETMSRAATRRRVLGVLRRRWQQQRWRQQRRRRPTDRNRPVERCRRRERTGRRRLREHRRR